MIGRRRRGGEKDLHELALFAREARESAYAPFSRFKVGAAVRLAGGKVITGCNVESASYGLTMCAERVAVFKAVSEGLTRFEAVAVVADSPRLTAPCGACRQVLWELCGDVPLRIEDLRGRARTVKMSELLPLPFDARNL
ncbi:MAG TPA: cytidine deaminase [Vicinamibacteria bacterium]